MRFERGNQFAPVKVGQEIDVKIEAVGEKGDGVAKVNGFVIFVPGTQAGEECHVKVTRVLKRVGFGEKVGPATGSTESDQTEESSEEPQEEEPEQQDSEDFGEESSDEESPDDSEENSDEPKEESENSDEPEDDSEESSDEEKKD